MLSSGCALGADTYWCSGLHLYTPLPFRPGKGGFGDYFKTHFFVGAGNLNSFNRREFFKLTFQIEAFVLIDTEPYSDMNKEISGWRW